MVFERYVTLIDSVSTQEVDEVDKTNNGAQ